MRKYLQRANLDTWWCRKRAFVCSFGDELRQPGICSTAVTTFTFQMQQSFICNSLSWSLQTRLELPVDCWEAEWMSGTQLCPTLRPPGLCLPGSSVPGILQARILEWVAISSSRGSSLSRDQTQVSCIAGRFFTIWATREDLSSSKRTVVPAKEGSIPLEPSNPTRM